MALPKFYKPNSSGTEQLLLSKNMQKACVKAAKVVESVARNTDLSMVGGSALDKSAYRASFTARESTVVIDRADRNKVRRGAVVVNEHELEYYFGGRSKALYKALQSTNGVVIQ